MELAHFHNWNSIRNIIQVSFECPTQPKMAFQNCLNSFESDHCNVLTIKNAHFFPGPAVQRQNLMILVLPNSVVFGKVCILKLRVECSMSRAPSISTSTSPETHFTMCVVRVSGCILSAYIFVA